MRSLNRWVALLAAVAVSLGSASRPVGNSGDLEILHFVCDGPNDPPAFTRDQVLAKVGEMYGDAKRDELDALTDPVNGTVGYAELGYSRHGGASDKSTIAINSSDYPLWMCATVFVHESVHCTRPRPAGLDGPDSTDPEVGRSNPCGDCNHAEMLGGDLADLRHLCIEQPEVFGGYLLHPCAEFCNMIDGINQLLDACADSTGCAFPNVDTTPPCECECE